MKNMTAKIGALLALTSTYSFALFGVGGHWAPNMGAKVSSLEEQIFFQDLTVGPVSDTISADLVRGGSDALNGFGLKLWIDALPVIDIEATVNFQGNTYPAQINYDLIGDDTGTQDIELRVPGSELLPIEKVDPAFGWMMADLSITYPIEIFSVPALFDWNIYLGGGMTYLYGTPIISKEFAETIVSGMMQAAVDQVEGGSTEAPTPDELAESLYDAFKDVEISHGVGGHAMIGTRIGLPLISIYANGKYHFGGLPEGISSGITLELGAGFGI